MDGPNDVVDEDGKATEAKSSRMSETTTGNFHNDRAGFVFFASVMCNVSFAVPVLLLRHAATAAATAAVTAYIQLAWADIKFTQACSVGRAVGRFVGPSVGRSVETSSNNWCMLPLIDKLSLSKQTLI